ncbi:MAG: hypothetical protein ABUL62_19420 [Myxococcales bacterium]
MAIYTNHDILRLAVEGCVEVKTARKFANPEQRVTMHATVLRRLKLAEAKLKLQPRVVAAGQ